MPAKPQQSTHYLAVSAEDLASFTKIIDSVLAVSDLQTISAKKIRKAIQATTDLDVASHKVGAKSATQMLCDLDTYHPSASHSDENF